MSKLFIVLMKESSVKADTRMSGVVVFNIEKVTCFKKKMMIIANKTYKQTFKNVSK